MLKTQKSGIIFLAIMITILFTSITTCAWDDCPFGIEDEAYPGTCWRYVDTNGDGICDHSQSEPTEENQEEPSESGVAAQKVDNSSKFPIMLIISLLITLVLIGFLKLFIRSKKLTSSKEKIFLNILLLIFFIPSAITGVILLLMTNMGILREFGQGFTLWHNISSLFFMWITAYHIIWHTKYYIKGVKSLFRAN
jgi:hypothetical protein